MKKIIILIFTLSLISCAGKTQIYSCIDFTYQISTINKDLKIYQNINNNQFKITYDLTNNIISGQFQVEGFYSIEQPVKNPDSEFVIEYFTIVKAPLVFYSFYNNQIEQGNWINIYGKSGNMEIGINTNVVPEFKNIIKNSNINNSVILDLEIINFHSGETVTNFLIHKANKK